MKGAHFGLLLFSARVILSTFLKSASKTLIVVVGS